MIRVLRKKWHQYYLLDWWTVAEDLSFYTWEPAESWALVIVCCVKCYKLLLRFKKGLEIEHREGVKEDIIMFDVEFDEVYGVRKVNHASRNRCWRSKHQMCHNNEMCFSSKTTQVSWHVWQPLMGHVKFVSPFSLSREHAHFHKPDLFTPTPSLY